MSRDIGRAQDGLKAAPEAPGDAEPEPDIPARPLTSPRSKLPTIPVDPDLLRYRHRLDRQLVAWRNSKSATSLSTALAITASETQRSEWRAPRLWTASIAACVVAGVTGWWVATAPAVRLGGELADTRQALQQEQDKVQKLGAALAAMARELGDNAAASADRAAAQDQEREALQQALRQSEAAAADVAQSFAQERDALKQALQKSEASAANVVQSLAQERNALQQTRRQSAAAAADVAQSFAQERNALQQALQKSEAAAANVVQSLAQERNALQQARQQSESAAQSLAQERERNQELERELAAHRQPVPEVAPPTAQATSGEPSAEKANADVMRLLARASLLVSQGDIGAARVVLEHAAGFGSASALFALAETFDPSVLSAWGTVGTQGDAARASDLYAKAMAGGVAAAKDRLATLRR